jgi:hypothetical protein
MSKSSGVSGFEGEWKVVVRAMSFRDCDKGLGNATQALD